MLNIEQGRMDAMVQGVPMQQVMEAVAGKTGIHIFIDPSLSAVPVSVGFHGLSFEEGLKKILGAQSYMMIFSSGIDETGNHPVKAIKVCPKGKEDNARYVSLNANGLAGLTSVGATVLTPQEVDDILEMDEQVNLSRVSQENAGRKNGKDMGNTPGNRSLVDEALQRAKKMQKYEELKAKTMNQNMNNYEARTALQLQQKKAAMDKIAFEHKRYEAAKTSLSRNFGH
ncbi:MAG: hypothetical protein AABY87_06685 [bacterium]